MVCALLSKGALLVVPLSFLFHRKIAMMASAARAAAAMAPITTPAIAPLERLVWFEEEGEEEGEEVPEPVDVDRTDVEV